MHVSNDQHFYSLDTENNNLKWKLAQINEIKI